MCIQTGKDHFIINDKEVSIKGKNLKEFIKEVNAKNKEKIILMQLKVAFELIKERLKNNNIYTLTLIEEDSEFITSDNPVIIENMDIDNIVSFDETNIFTLPIDNKTKLFLMPNTDLSLRFKINKNFAVGYYCRMEAFLSNLNQYERADKFLLGKESSIKKFLLTKDVTELKKTKEEENDWQAILKHLGM